MIFPTTMELIPIYQQMMFSDFSHQKYEIFHLDSSFSKVLPPSYAGL